MSTQIKFGSKSSIIFGAVFGAVGLVVAGFGVNELTQADASASWPSVAGTVVSSQVKKSTSSRGTGRKRRRSTSHSASIVYEYTVDSRKHTAKRVSFGATSSSASSAREIVSRYPKGKAVTVYYDPADPERAVLEPGTSGGTYIPLGVGVVFAAIGGYMAVGGLLVRKKRLAAAAGDDDAVATQ